VVDGSATSTVIGDDFDAVLVEAKAQQPSAVERLYRSTAPIVLGYLRSNRVADPEDVTSDVFVSMLRGIDGFTGDERAFRSWLLTIAHHRMVDAVRKSQRTREDPAPFETLVAESVDSVDGEAGALHRLESHGVLAAMESLTEDQRAALMLRVLADLSVSEISKALGKPETAVKALLRRGFASLRRALATDESSDGEP
jgi:RNA polymerase sigma factor (sigma-70 family)